MLPETSETEPFLPAPRDAAEELRAQAEELRLLYEAGQALGSTLDPDEIYHTMHRLVAQSMDCDGLIVSSFDPETELIRCVYAWVEGNNVDPATFPPMPLAPPGQGVQSGVIRSGETLLVADADAAYSGSANKCYVDPDGTVRDRPAPDKPRTRSLMMAPIKLGGRVLGIVHITSNRPGAYTERDKRLLEAMVLQMAAAGRNAFLYREVQQELREREQHEAEIASLNARLERAVRETHHRVKNNLQLVAGLIDMVSMTDEEAVPVVEVRRLAAHVRALATVHELLTERSAEGSGSVSSRQVLPRLLTLLQQASYGREILSEIADTPLTARQSTGISIVLNELISNAIKHGSGAIGVQFRVAADQAVLEVSDDGPGFPVDFDSAQHAGTGLSLVDRLIGWDLGGRVEYGNDQAGGARVRVTLPVAHVPA